MTPAHALFGGPQPDVVELGFGEHILAAGENTRAVLAGRVALASLDGAPLFELPADQRIYVGGGGSIRPYAYQTAGPLAPNKTDRRQIEPGVKFGSTGQNYANDRRCPVHRRRQLLREERCRSSANRLLYGVGLGLRYYTAFGPLRLDLATPLYRRPSDSPIQVYISLGEAF